MRVLVTGATGFVGTYVIAALLGRGHTVRALVRQGSLRKLDARDDRGVEPFGGDVLDPQSLARAVEDCDAAVHLVGIIEEDARRGQTFERMHVDATRHVVEAARAAGVGRFVHMSANGARPPRQPGPSGSTPGAYHTTKHRAEVLVRDAGFAQWAVFRPSILFGDPDPRGEGAGRPEFASRLWATLVRPFPVLPILGDGTYAVQPVHVAAGAEAFARAVDEPSAHAQTFVAAGPEVVPFNEVVDRIALAAGVGPKPKAHIPLALARLMVSTAGRVGLMPISPAQFEMLVEGNTGDPAAFVAAFGEATVPFTPDHLRYVRGKG